MLSRRRFLQHASAASLVLSPEILCPAVFFLRRLPQPQTRPRGST